MTDLRQDILSRLEDGPASETAIFSLFHMRHSYDRIAVLAKLDEMENEGLITFDRDSRTWRTA